jgi:hypothetical protein
MKFDIIKVYLHFSANGIINYNKRVITGTLHENLPAFHLESSSLITHRSEIFLKLKLCMNMDHAFQTQCKRPSFRDKGVNILYCSILLH